MVQEKEWQPVTKLGRLVKAGKIKSMEEMYVGPDNGSARELSDSV